MFSSRKMVVMKSEIHLRMASPFGIAFYLKYSCNNKLWKFRTLVLMVTYGSPVKCKNYHIKSTIFTCINALSYSFYLRILKQNTTAILLGNKGAFHIFLVTQIIPMQNSSLDFSIIFHVMTGIVL